VDGANFDIMAKQFANGTSRRRLLKTAFGIAFGGALTGVISAKNSASATGRGLNQICRKNSDCASGRCGPKDFTGRSRCQCQSGSDCPAPGGCHAATCSNGICGATAVSDVTCDDGNLCTTSTICQAGVCSGINVPNGTSCGTNKACVTGVCLSGCTIANEVYAPGAINPVNSCESCQLAVSTTAWTIAANNTSCDDDNNCTQTDTCQSGVCVGGNSVVCTASDPCHNAGVCNTQTGLCSNPSKPDGTSCNDQNLCSQTDTCQTGVCSGANPIICAPPDSCHQQGVCNTATGLCEYALVADGTSCNDGNLCTAGETCQSGDCIGTPVDCNDNNVCTTDTCEADTGCIHTPISCDDNNDCTNDSCDPVAGCQHFAVDCDDGNPCTINICIAVFGCDTLLAADGTTCNDGNPDTCNDVCTLGVCAGTAVEKNASTDGAECTLHNVR